ncbi:MAG: CBS domain-containing protein [Candidatus Competibacter sp.]|nr:CBS domain-containing protein [Candidatus Competibacteraceae bacterium]
MTAQNLMNPKPVTLRLTDTVAAAAEYIIKEHLRHIPVIDDQSRYAGTFSIYSLLQLALPKAVTMKEGLSNAGFVNEEAPELAKRLRERGNEPVSKWLSKDPVLHPDSSAMDALLLLLQGHVSVPVVDKQSQRLVGMISSWNVIEKLTAENK